MSRMLRTDWLFRGGKSKVKKNEAKRSLSCEPLEDRRVLATLVGTEADLRTALTNGDACVELTANITLTTGELAITQAVDIDGAGFTIDGNGGSRVMNIDDADTYIDSFAVNLSNLTVTGGNVNQVGAAGGGILAVEEVSLDNVTLTGNYLYNVGGNTDLGMYYSGGGGGISSVGTTTITNSNITGNTVVSGDIFSGTANYIDASGGGVSAGGVGSLTMTNTTVSGNTVTAPEGFGGGVASDGDGGTTISGSTISNNVAENTAGGIRLSGYGVISITDTTISGNTAGIGTDGTSAGGGGVSIGGGDVVDVTITDSHIDGNAVVAYESGAGAVFPYAGGVEVAASGTVTITDSSLDNNTVDGTGTATVLARGGGLAVAATDVTVNITGGTVSGNTVTATGPNSYGGAVSPGAGFTAGNTMTVNIDGTVMSGNKAGSGGAVGSRISFGHHDVNITNATITGNTSTDVFGGGAFTAILDQTTTISNTEISGNVAYNAAGGLTNSKAFTGNAAVPNSYQQANLYITDSTIADNTSYGTAGGLDLTTSGLTYAGADPNNVVITNSTISGNSAAGNAGGLSVYDSNVTINQSTISGNSTNGVGGGFYGRIACNPVAADGPCYLGGPNEAVFNIDRSTFAYNYSGGGETIQIFDNTSATITNTLITDNTAPAGSDFLGGGGAGNPTTGALPMITLDYSWVQNDGNGSAVGVGGTGNVIGAGAAGISALADNGGPTMTHALTAGSLAIDAADPSVTGGTDQRGAGPRDFGGRMDIGAYEFGATIITVANPDFDGDNDADCDDINMLSNEVAAGTNGAAFDMNGDTFVNAADIAEWLVVAGARAEHAAATGGNPFLLGDANLDGFVNGGDFLIWNSFKFTTNANYCDGDFNGDGFVNGGDFLIWNGNKFTDSMNPIVSNAGPSDLVRESSDATGQSGRIGKLDVERSMAINNEAPMEARSRFAQLRRADVDRTPAAAPVAVAIAQKVEASLAGEAGTVKLVGADRVIQATSGPALQAKAVSSFESIANHDDAEEEAVDQLFASLGGL